MTATMSNHSRVHQTPFKAPRRRPYSPMTTDFPAPAGATHLVRLRAAHLGRPGASPARTRARPEATGRPSWSRLPSRASSKRRRRNPSSWPTTSPQPQPRLVTWSGPAARTAVFPVRHLDTCERPLTSYISYTGSRPHTRSAHRTGWLGRPSSTLGGADRTAAKPSRCVQPRGDRYGCVRETKGAPPTAAGQQSMEFDSPRGLGPKRRSVQAVWRHTNSRNRAGDSMILPRRYSDSDCAPHLWELPGCPKTPEEPASTWPDSSLVEWEIRTTPRRIPLPSAACRPHVVVATRQCGRAAGVLAGGASQRPGSSPGQATAHRLQDNHRPHGRSRPYARTTVRVAGLQRTHNYGHVRDRPGQEPRH